MPPPRRQLAGWEQPEGLSGAAAPPAKKARVEPPDSEPPAAVGEKKALTFKERLKMVAGDDADYSKCLMVFVTSTGGTSCLDNVWEEAHLVPERVLGDEYNKISVRRSILRWPSFNYLEDFEADYPKLFTTIVPGTEAPYYIGSLEDYPEMTTWVARTVLKDIVNIDGSNW